MNILSAPARIWLATLLAGLPGVALFLLLGLPLPWLLGPMVAVALVSIRLRTAIPPALRDVSLLLLGLQVGASMTPEAGQRLMQLPVVAAFLVLATVAAMWSGYVVYSRLARWDRVTSFLAASPGALSTVIALSQDAPGDMAKVMLAQTSRLAALLMIFPIAFGMGDADGVAEHAVQVWTMAEHGLAMVSAVAAGAVLAWRKLPAGWILGPAAMVAALTMSEIIEGGPHPVVFQTGLFIIGAATGAKLAGGFAHGWRASLAFAVLGLVAMVAASSAVALLAWPVTGLPLDILLIAFAPGGLEAMIAMAVALGLDPALVSAAHVSRVFGLTLLLPLVYRWRG